LWKALKNKASHGQDQNWSSSYWIIAQMTSKLLTIKPCKKLFDTSNNLSSFNISYTSNWFIRLIENVLLRLAFYDQTSSLFWNINIKFTLKLEKIQIYVQQYTFKDVFLHFKVKSSFPFPKKVPADLDHLKVCWNFKYVKQISFFCTG